MGDPERSTAPAAARPDALAALRRIALAAVHPGGDTLYDDLMAEVATALGAPVVFCAVFTDEAGHTARVQAGRLDGAALSPFEYVVSGTPCEQVRGRAFRYVGRGIAAEMAPDAQLAGRGLDAYAAVPLVGHDGTPLGVLAAMDRSPVAGGDADHAEAVLKVVAGRLAAELERGRSDELLRATALAVSSAQGDTVFDELVRLLGRMLNVELAFIARQVDGDDDGLHIQAMYRDGQVARGGRYAVAGTPCQTVIGQQFRAYPQALGQRFPDDPDIRSQAFEAYAGFPLTATDGHALGIISVSSRRPLARVERVEATLKIFAVRAAAELERLAASEALQRSEASYRAIFEAAQDAIFVHDWHSGAIVDVNPKAAELCGWPREVLRTLSVADLSAGVPPYTEAEAKQWFQLAKLDRCPPFEWHRRHRDGSLHWDEVRLKPALIEGRPHIVAFTREITAQKEALEALRTREEQYRAIFDGSVDPMVLWDAQLRVVDVNTAFERVTGMARSTVIGRHWRERPDAADMERLLPMIESALAGREANAIERVSRADGSRFDIELRYLPVRLGGQAYALGIGRDVTERLERERALSRSEAQYRDIFNASADALVLRAADFSIVEVNATYEQMSGYRRDEVLGVDRVLANPSEAAGTIRALHARALSGETVLVRTQLVRRDGTRYELELRGVPVEHGGRPHVLYIGRDITQAVLAEKALSDSESQYRAIFNASADALILWNSHYERVDVNPAYERIYGWSRDEVIGRSYDTAYLSEDYVRPRRELVRRALAGEACRAELVAVRKSGERIQTEVHAIPFTHRGEPHVLAIARDITERHRAELALRHSEEQHRTIFNASVDGLLVKDADNTVVDVNEAYLRMHGFQREELLGHCLLDKLPAPLRAQCEQLLPEVLAGAPCHIEAQTYRGDGSLLDVEIHGVPVFYGGRTRALVVMRDITERKQSEVALRASEEQYRAIFNASADALVLRDAGFRVVEVNPAFVALSGFAREEVLNTDLVLAGEDTGPTDHREEHARVLAGEVMRFERTVRRKDGERRQVEVRGTPVIYRGQPHVLYAVRDMTARHEAERQRADLERQLRQSQKMEAIGQLTGGIAHDFNNILTSVIGYLVMAEERAESLDDAALRRQLGQAHLAAQRARDLIAQMMAFARRQRSETRVLALAPLVLQTLTLLKATLPSSVEVDLDPLQATDPQLSVEADPVQIEQVLFNLCINARDAMQGHGRIEVRLRRQAAHDGGWACASCRHAVAAGDWVELAVADTGPGIGPALLERIFDPFFSTKPPGQGSGMGLAMVHGIVHNHGGHVRVLSRPGEGTVFGVWLPLATAPLPADGRPARSLPARKATLQGRVLVVEDDPIAGDFLRERLESWGLDVRLERDPVAAAAWLAEPGHEVDLLLTDLTMPQLTGLQLAERVHRHRPGLPIVLASGHLQALDATEMNARGIRAALPKPLDAMRLHQVLEQCLNAAPA
jgi:PAS domain S-box-containing protein